MRLFWVIAALLALCSQTSALFPELITLSPTLAKIVMFSLGTLGPTFFTTGFVYLLGRHFGYGEIRPKFKKPTEKPKPKPAGNRFDFAPPEFEGAGQEYAFYAPEESPYAAGDLRRPYRPYLEGRSTEQQQNVPEQVPAEVAAVPQQQQQFTHPRGRKIVRRT